MRAREEHSTIANAHAPRQARFPAKAKKIVKACFP